MFNNPSADSTAVTRALWGQALGLGSGNLTVSGLRGVQGQAEYQGSGTVAGAMGFTGFVANTGPGTIQNAYSVYAFSPFATLGAIERKYGVFIENVSGGTLDNFALHAAGGKSFFGGNVGIGNSAPAAKLHIAADDRHNSLLLKSSGPNDQPGIYWERAAGDKWNLFSRNAGDGLTFFEETAGSAGHRLFLQEGGNVGIGTTAPSQKLEVAGNVKISGGGNGLIFPDSTVQTSAAVGDITAVVASTGLIGGATSGLATLELSGGARARGINYLAGCDSCGLLVDADDQKTFFQNVCDAVTINTVTCFSDAGSPVINIQRQVGVAAPVNVLSPDLTCSTTGASGAIVGAQSVLNTGDKLDFVMVTAGGTAKRVTVVIKTTMN
jgi:hypothetical protein